jgi:hypothetical protein
VAAAVLLQEVGSLRRVQMEEARRSMAVMEERVLAEVAEVALLIAESRGITIVTAAAAAAAS